MPALCRLLAVLLLLALPVPAQDPPERRDFADPKNGIAFRAPTSLNILTVPLEDRDVHQLVPDTPDGSTFVIVCFHPGVLGDTSPREQFRAESATFLSVLRPSVGRDVQVVREVEQEVGGQPAYRVEFQGNTGRANLVLIRRGDRCYRVLFTAPLRSYLRQNARFERILGSVTLIDPTAATEPEVRAGAVLGWLAKVGGRVQVWTEAILETPPGSATTVEAIEIMLRDSSGEVVQLRHLRGEELFGVFGRGEVGPQGLVLPPNGAFPVFVPPLDAGRLAPSELQIGFRLRRGDSALLRVIEGPCRRRGPARPLAFPLQGKWFVAWGPDHHAPHRRAAVVVDGALTGDQRFALDLVRLDPQGNSYEGGGEQLSDYYSFGQPVSAAAAGTVVAVESGRPDLPIGRRDPAQPRGNFVIIRHLDGLTSTYAHLQQGSVQVAEGDRVEVGQPVGLVGNSGNTSEPHLHYHLAQGDAFPGSQGLPTPFANMELKSGDTWFPLDGMPPHGSLIRTKGR